MDDYKISGKAIERKRGYNNDELFAKMRRLVEELQGELARGNYADAEDVRCEISGLLGEIEDDTYEGE